LSTKGRILLRTC